MSHPSSSQSISLNAVIGLIVVAGTMMILSVLYAHGDLITENHSLAMPTQSTSPTGCTDPGYGIC